MNNIIPFESFQCLGLLKSKEFLVIKQVNEPIIIYTA